MKGSIFSLSLIYFSLSLNVFECLASGTSAMISDLEDALQFHDSNPISAIASSFSDVIPDLAVESKLIGSALMETQNFLYSNEIKMPDVDYKIYLQSKILRRLQAAIDRWTLHEMVLRDNVIAGGYQQVILLP
jgi:hypothetical protein